MQACYVGLHRGKQKFGDPVPPPGAEGRVH